MVQRLTSASGRAVGMCCLYLCLFFFIGSAVAQTREYSVKDKKAIALYEKAVSEYHYEYFAEALNTLDKVKRRNQKFIEAYLLSAQIYEHIQQYEAALEENLRALALDSTFYPRAQFDAARLSFYSQHYEQGRELSERYLQKITPKDRAYRNAELVRESCIFALWTLQHPVSISPRPLPSTVNTRNDEYFPSISADEQTLSITRLLPVIGQTHRKTMQEDLYLSKRVARDSTWQEARNIGAPVTTPYNEGSQSLSADGRRMYYSYCDGPCKIYYADLEEDGNWSTPQALPPVINMPRMSTKQPSISPDGRSLYFTSNRPGGYGGYDLWVAHYQDGVWGNVTNLGPTINTADEEQSPFMHFDNRTLYFSSNGHPGLGDLDLYKTTRTNDTIWSTPQNLGYPINTPATDMGMVISASGENAYYASSRNERQGMDIYTFEMPASLRPNPVSYLLGQVQDATNGSAIAAHCQLIDLETQEVVMHQDSDPLGRFLVCLPMGRKYAFFASKEGYFDNSLHFDFLGVHSASAPYRQTIGLMPMKTGVTLTLRNVFFDTDSDILRPESFTELDRWCRIMLDRPEMRIQIEGHTDDQGDASYNLQLSQRRANSVVTYLVSHGVPAGRISKKGFGSTKPAQSNTTPEGRAANRRTECRILAL